MEGNQSCIMDEYQPVTTRHCNNKVSASFMTKETHKIRLEIVHNGEYVS